ncbi:hypothetical protein SARC_07094 [Sphaeroforma arctica JP610]|uniref:C2H2-type domain-containing protein n=1 Tax=Sphaeroforma arctica JP610 TaxID=667725 RepID=A0A0L0FUN8_9EUKA|nr:hypothetical protein SARC_07094 [Sphaeroforma arctica JP610]KNC80547.1 hypothetical protein SARC_07094 [Sphaeroforma arctica JP610]|eukprot:XP_014154449.1 hypothetical protein SARC_07094 [Sphaeroforma arctica JP610]
MPSQLDLTTDYGLYARKQIKPEEIFSTSGRTWDSPLTANSPSENARSAEKGEEVRTITATARPNTEVMEKDVSADERDKTGYEDGRSKPPNTQHPRAHLATIVEWPALEVDAPAASIRGELHTPGNRKPCVQTVLQVHTHKGKQIQSLTKTLTRTHDIIRTDEEKSTLNKQSAVSSMVVVETTAAKTTYDKPQSTEEERIDDANWLLKSDPAILQKQNIAALKTIKEELATAVTRPSVQEHRQVTGQTSLGGMQSSATSSTVSHDRNRDEKGAEKAAQKCCGELMDDRGDEVKEEPTGNECQDLDDRPFPTYAVTSVDSMTLENATDAASPHMDWDGLVIPAGGTQAHLNDTRSTCGTSHTSSRVGENPGQSSISGWRKSGLQKNDVWLPTTPVKRPVGTPEESKSSHAGETAGSNTTTDVHDEVIRIVRLTPDWELDEFVSSRPQDLSTPMRTNILSAMARDIMVDLDSTRTGTEIDEDATRCVVSRGDKGDVANYTQLQGQLNFEKDRTTPRKTTTGDTGDDAEMGFVNTTPDIARLSPDIASDSDEGPPDTSHGQGVYRKSPYDTPDSFQDQVTASPYAAQAVNAPQQYYDTPGSTHDGFGVIEDGVATEISSDEKVSPLPSERITPDTHTELTGESAETRQVPAIRSADLPLHQVSPSNQSKVNDTSANPRQVVDVSADTLFWAVEKVPGTVAHDHGIIHKNPQPRQVGLLSKTTTTQQPISLDTLMECINTPLTFPGTTEVSLHTSQDASGGSLVTPHTPYVSVRVPRQPIISPDTRQNVSTGLQNVPEYVGEVPSSTFKGNTVSSDTLQQLDMSLDSSQQVVGSSSGALGAVEILSLDTNSMADEFTDDTQRQFKHPPDNSQIEARKPRHKPEEREGESIKTSNTQGGMCDTLQQGITSGTCQTTLEMSRNVTEGVDGVLSPSQLNYRQLPLETPHKIDADSRDPKRSPIIPTETCQEMAQPKKAGFSSMEMPQRSDGQLLDTLPEVSPVPRDKCQSTESVTYDSAQSMKELTADLSAANNEAEDGSVESSHNSNAPTTQSSWQVLAAFPTTSPTIESVSCDIPQTMEGVLSHALTVSQTVTHTVMRKVEDTTLQVDEVLSTTTPHIIDGESQATAQRIRLSTYTPPELIEASPDTYQVEEEEASALRLQQVAKRLSSDTSQRDDTCHDTPPIVAGGGLELSVEGVALNRVSSKTVSDALPNIPRIVDKLADTPHRSPSTPPDNSQGTHKGLQTVCMENERRPTRTTQEVCVLHETPQIVADISADTPMDLDYVSADTHRDTMTPSPHTPKDVAEASPEKSQDADRVLHKPPQRDKEVTPDAPHREDVSSATPHAAIGEPLPQSKKADGALPVTPQEFNSQSPDNQREPSRASLDITQDGDGSAHSTTRGVGRVTPDIPTTHMETLTSQGTDNLSQLSPRGIDRPPNATSMRSEHVVSNTAHTLDGVPLSTARQTVDVAVKRAQTNSSCTPEAPPMVDVPVQEHFEWADRVSFESTEGQAEVSQEVPRVLDGSSPDSTQGIVSVVIRKETGDAPTSGHDDCRTATPDRSRELQGVSVASPTSAKESRDAAQNGEGVLTDGSQRVDGVTPSTAQEVDGGSHLHNDIDTGRVSDSAGASPEDLPVVAHVLSAFATAPTPKYTLAASPLARLHLQQSLMLYHTFRDAPIHTPADNSADTPAEDCGDDVCDKSTEELRADNKPHDSDLMDCQGAEDGNGSSLTDEPRGKDQTDTGGAVVSPARVTSAVSGGVDVDVQRAVPSIQTTNETAIHANHTTAQTREQSGGDVMGSEGTEGRTAGNMLADGSAEDATQPTSTGGNGTETMERAFSVQVADTIDTAADARECVHDDKAEGEQGKDSITGESTTDDTEESDIRAASISCEGIDTKHGVCTVQAFEDRHSKVHSSERPKDAQSGDCESSVLATACNEKPEGERSTEKERDSNHSTGVAETCAKIERSTLENMDEAQHRTLDVENGDSVASRMSVESTNDDRGEHTSGLINTNQSSVNIVDSRTHTPKENAESRERANDQRLLESQHETMHRGERRGTHAIDATSGTSTDQLDPHNNPSKSTRSMQECTAHVHTADATEGTVDTLGTQRGISPVLTTNTSVSDSSDNSRMEESESCTDQGKVRGGVLAETERLASACTSSTPCIDGSCGDTQPKPPEGDTRTPALNVGARVAELLQGHKVTLPDELLMAHDMVISDELLDPLAVVGVYKGLSAGADTGGSLTTPTITPTKTSSTLDTRKARNRTTLGTNPCLDTPRIDILTDAHTTATARDVSGIPTSAKIVSTDTSTGALGIPSITTANKSEPLTLTHRTHQYTKDGGTDTTCASGKTSSSTISPDATNTEGPNTALGSHVLTIAMIVRDTTILSTPDETTCISSMPATTKAHSKQYTSQRADKQTSGGTLDLSAEVDTSCTTTSSKLSRIDTLAGERATDLLIDGPCSTTAGELLMLPITTNQKNTSDKSQPSGTPITARILRPVRDNLIRVPPDPGSPLARGQVLPMENKLQADPSVCIHISPNGVTLPCGEGHTHTQRAPDTRSDTTNSPAGITNTHTERDSTPSRTTETRGNRSERERRVHLKRAARWEALTNPPLKRMITSADRRGGVYYQTNTDLKGQIGEDTQTHIARPSESEENFGAPRGGARVTKVEAEEANTKQPSTESERGQGRPDAQAQTEVMKNIQQPITIAEKDFRSPRLRSANEDQGYSSDSDVPCSADESIGGESDTDVQVQRCSTTTRRPSREMPLRAQDVKDVGPEQPKNCTVSSEDESQDHGSEGEESAARDSDRGGLGMCAHSRAAEADGFIAPAPEPIPLQRIKIHRTDPEVRVSRKKVINHAATAKTQRHVLGSQYYAKAFRKRKRTDEPKARTERLSRGSDEEITNAHSLRKRHRDRACVQFVCQWKDCDKSFVDENAYRQHVMRHANAQKQAQCPCLSCGELFDSRECRAMHERAHRADGSARTTARLGVKKSRGRRR